MVHAQGSDGNMHFSLIYMNDHIFPVLPIKHLVNHDSEPNTPHKLTTDTNASVSNLHVLFCLCVLIKVTAHIYTKALNMRHQPQKYFRSILVGIPQHQKGYLIYVPIIRK